MTSATVLLIEDDEFMVKQLKTLVNAAGFDTFIHFDSLPGKEVMESADLIITDIQLPNMVGISHIDRIIELKNNTPVILISGMDPLTLSSTLGILKMKRVNIVASFGKPFNRKEFKELLTKYLPQ
ncbi:response regulator [Shewanella atlantica]|uniref:Response regulator n=1 Tax=Shewanella atlantica TaxID=271099 RepID=A0A3S0KFH6_9GAMM|nr:response regulator [Shewanella atlantica]RTR29680.1 response regulator [Shewanella atlantica]